LSEYQAVWKEQAENAKTKKLPTSALYVTPEYTLPGGRCMSSDTYIKCMIEKVIVETTIEYLFDEFERGKEIKVLSMGENKEIVYSFVGKIWKSGQKLTYIVETEDYKIRLSEEHLVYLPSKNKYAATINLVSGDSVLVIKDNVLVAQKLITPPYPYEIEDVFDIEIPSVKNFIGNNIVSHNSRWFRYLYKSG